MTAHLKEWSKLLTLVVLLPYLIVLSLGIALNISLYMAEAHDACVSVFIALCGYVAAPVGVIYGFYFWKSKAENLAKLAKDLKSAGVSDDVAGAVCNTSQIGGN